MTWIMAEDFHINYSGASRWDEGIIGIRMLREPPRERIDALLPILRQLLQSETDPGEKYICPICDKEFKITFEYLLELPDELDISSDCRTCNFYVFFKSNGIPKWARGVSLLDGRNFLDRR